MIANSSELDACLYALKPLFDEKKIIQVERRMGKSTSYIFAIAKIALPPEKYEEFCKMYQEILNEAEEK